MENIFTRGLRSAILTKHLLIFKNSIRWARAVDLVYKVHGNTPSADSTPVIVIHGLLGSKKNWESVSKSLASTSKKSVVVVDARNHGESPHASSHTYPELAADVAKLIVKLSVKQAHIIGHSMGGRTGMVLALTEPQKVSSLIVVDISPVSTPGILDGFFPSLIKVMKTCNFTGMDTVPKARDAAKKTFVESGIIKNPDGLYFVLMHIGKRSDNSIGWVINLDALERHFPDIATFPNISGSYSGPALFIGGDESDYLPLTDLPGIQKLFPKAEIKQISGVGHNVHAEDPTAFLKMVNDFLSNK